MKTPNAKCTKQKDESAPRFWRAIAALATSFHQTTTPRCELKSEVHPPSHHLSNAKNIDCKWQLFKSKRHVKCTWLQQKWFTSNAKGFVIPPRTTRRLPKRTSSSKQLLWIHTILNRSHTHTGVTPTQEHFLSTKKFEGIKPINSGTHSPTFHCHTGFWESPTQGLQGIQKMLQHWSLHPIPGRNQAEVCESVCSYTRALG